MQSIWPGFFRGSHGKIWRNPDFRWRWLKPWPAAKDANFLNLGAWLKFYTVPTKCPLNILKWIIGASAANFAVEHNKLETPFLWWRFWGWGARFSQAQQIYSLWFGFIAWTCHAVFTMKVDFPPSLQNHPQKNYPFFERLIFSRTSNFSPAGPLV